MAAGDVEANITSLNAKKCAVFDGVDDRVDLGNVGELDILNYISITAWIKPDDLSGTQTIISNRPNATNYWQFRLAGDDLQFAGAVGGSGDAGAAANIISSNTWQHVGMTFEGATKKLNLYLDGVRVLTYDVLAENVLQAMNSQAILGTIKQSVTAEMFGGCMADVQIWNKILTPTEEARVYAGEQLEEDRLHRWKLDTDYTD